MAAALLLLATGPLAAQQGGGPPSETALLAGPSSYDLSGTGTSFAANLSSTVRLAGRVLLFSPNFGYFTYRTQFGNRRHFLFPEAGLQLQVPMGRFRPYLGAGAGAGIDTRGGPSQLDFTLHAAAGFRLRVRSDWGVRGEVRVRPVDPFHGHTADFGLGITRGIP
jgi:hypothetical protein